jgi:hypothetical protein
MDPAPEVSDRPFSPTSEREKLILELSQGLPESRSWLDSLALTAIRALSHENVSAIFKPISGATLPVVSMGQPAPVTTHSVAPVATDSAAAPLSPAVLEKLLALSANSERIPKHFIQPPKQFGTGKLSDEQITRLGSFRKDTRFSSTLEAHLQWLNQIAGKCPHASEKSLIDNIHVCLPLPCLKDLEFLKRKTNSSLSDIFVYLQTHYGSALSRSEVFKSLSDLTSSIGEIDPLTVLQRISMLLLQVTEDTEDCERAALRDSLSYLKTLLGTEMFLNLQMFLGNGSFSDLYRICKTDYNEILLSRYQEKRQGSGKIRNIIDKDVLPETSNPSIVTAPADVEDVVRQIMGRNGVSLSCFLCGSPQHLMKECPSYQRQPSTPPKPQPQHSSSGKKSSSSRLPYADLRCSLHKNSNHNNSECYKQLNIPCPFHNGSHSQAACKRLDAGSSKSPPKQQPPPQHLFPLPHQQYSTQQPQQQGSQQQHPPPGYQQQLVNPGYQQQQVNPGYQQPWVSTTPFGYHPLSFPQQFHGPPQGYHQQPLRPQPSVPQPGTARHLALQRGASSNASSTDPLEFDEDTKRRLLRALSEALSE